MYKCIVTHKAGGQSYTNGFIIAHHYSHSYKAFGELVKEALETFRSLKYEDIQCRTVLESRWCKNCPLICFSLPIGTKKKYWSQREERLPDISW